MKRWWISDTHLGDDSLLKRRYSKTVDQFDSHLASRWDAVVEAGDEVWVLGDVARGRADGYIRDWFEARPGTKHLILGNWDIGNVDFAWEDMGFDLVANNSAVMLSNGLPAWMSHYPYGHDRNPELPYVLLHGHTHSPHKVKRSKPSGVPMIHVGWDAWHRMVPEADIIDLIEKELKA